jgi:hypothetical protein
VNLTIVAANQPPAIAIITPAPNTLFTAPASVALTVQASATDGTITRVSYFNGTQKIGDSYSPPYSLTWNAVPAGTYTLSARATDNHGATTTSDAVEIIVAPDPRPVVTLLAPAAGSSHAAPATILLEAGVIAPDETVAKVEFFAGNTKIGEVTAPPYQMAWNAVPAGLHAVQAVATTTTGLQGVSLEANLTVTGNRLPEITLLAPEDRHDVSYAGTAMTLTARGRDPGGRAGADRIPARHHADRDLCVQRVRRPHRRGVAHVVQQHAGHLHDHGPGLRCTDGASTDSVPAQSHLRRPEPPADRSR